jgi:hypothetical protein
MSPRRGRASPIRKIKLRFTLEGGGPSLKRASKALDLPIVAGRRVLANFETTDADEAIKIVRRVGEAVKDEPKDFK